MSPRKDKLFHHSIYVFKHELVAISKPTKWKVTHYDSIRGIAQSQDCKVCNRYHVAVYIMEQVLMKQKVGRCIFCLIGMLRCKWALTKHQIICNLALLDRIHLRKPITQNS
jgi:hypothetical protein